MTVRELIEKLEDMPSYATVYVEGEMGWHKLNPDDVVRQSDPDGPAVLLQGE